jgi:hypothetical protein
MWKLENNDDYTPSYKHLAWLLEDHPAYTSDEEEDSHTRYILEEFSMNMQEDESITSDAKNKMMRKMVDFILKLSRLEDNSPEYRRIALFLESFYPKKVCNCTCASSDDEDGDDEDEDEDGDDGDGDDDDGDADDDSLY